MPDRPNAPTREQPSATELLNRLLAALEVEVDTFAICEVSRGWRLAFDPDDALTVHYGLIGSGVTILADGRRFGLARDTLLLLPPRVGHSFELPEGSTREIHARSQLPSLVNGELKIRAGTDEVGFAVACGTIRASYAGILDIFAYLTDPIVESFEGSRSLRGAFEAVLAELAAPTVGTGALTSALLRQCLVLLLRRQSIGHGATASWLLAVGNARLARVVLAMLERLAEPHTLGSLARIAGMSRSVFAERFSAVLGRSPIALLKEVRLSRAAHLLETTDLPVKVVARSVGYSSRSYFSRAFKELHDIDPASFRARASTKVRIGDIPPPMFRR